jgi:hypothetical protein
MASNKEFDIRENETYGDWKRRKHEERGMSGIGQKNKKDRTNWSEQQKRGLRNKNKGRRKQNLARKKLGIPNAKFRSNMGNEENWGGQVRVEVKAGKQIESIWKKYLAAKLQSDVNNNAIGNTKPFLFVVMPDGVTNGLVICELDKFEDVVYSMIETWKENENG